MRRTLIILLAAGALLGGCDMFGDKPPTKRQPGSWTSKIQVVRLEGADVKAGTKEQMQAMFDMFGTMSVCLTPEAVAQDDVAQNLERATGQGKCTFDKKKLSGDSLEFTGICNAAGGEKVNLTAKGTNGATSQDITVTAQRADAAGKDLGVMEMRITSKRNGECTDKDIRPPAPAQPKAQ